MTGSSHLDDAGAARMVDVSGKPISTRVARAAGFVELSSECVAALRSNDVPKGDALAVARIAGLMAVKRTPDLIPLCHPIAVHSAAVDLTVVDAGVGIEAEVGTADRTGVEMEALTAVSVAALALIDMVKSIDPAAVVDRVRLLAKSGGKSGDWVRA